MFLLPAICQSSQPAVSTVATPAPRVIRVDYRLNLSKTKSLVDAAVARHDAKVAMLMAIPDYDNPASAYVSQRRLPRPRPCQGEPWLPQVEVIPADKMVIETADGKRVVALGNSLSGSEALRTAAKNVGKRDRRAEAQERYEAAKARSDAEFWPGFERGQQKWQAAQEALRNEI